uniref:Uncharacterized protein n=1 Tax=Arundo donax TaxID=35708 RepID=A0A0A9I3I3_ARUDO
MSLTQEMIFNFVLREPFKTKTTNSIAMEKLGLENKKILGPQCLETYNFIAVFSMQAEMIYKSQ